MGRFRSSVPPGSSITAWLVSSEEKRPFHGVPATLEDRVGYRFVNGFVDVGDLPCRTAWRETMIGCDVVPPRDFAVERANLPGDNRRVEFTGFWHTPVHLSRWCRTRLRPSAPGNHRFRLATCGGVRIWVDGELLTVFEPFERNTERQCVIELPLRAYGSDILLLCEELAERDTLWYFELRNEGDGEVVAELPLAVPAEDLELLRALARQTRPDLDFFTRATPFALAFETAAPRDIVVDVTVQRHSHDLSHSRLLSRTLVLPAGAIRLEVAAGGEIPEGMHAVTLAFRIGEASVERSIDAAFLSDVLPSPAPATLQERKREALRYLARLGEHRIGKALAILECDAGNAQDDEVRALIQSTLGAIERREDCSDFVMVPLLWLYAAHGERLPADLTAAIRTAVLGWRYWVDEPGNDAMWFWSENHVLCFHCAQLLAGRLFPGERFAASGRRGAEQARLAEGRLAAWFDAVEAHGFAEWNSAAYYPVDFIGLFALERWAGQLLAGRARAQLDQLFAMIALHTLGGVPAGSMGRAYDKELKAGPLTELAPFCRVAFGTGWLNGGVASLPLFAASNYAPPARCQRYVELPVDATLTAGYVQGYRPARLRLFKTPDVQLSTVMDGQPGAHGHQQHVIDLRFAAHPFARAWINHPGEDDPFGQQRPSYWAGNGSMPRVVQDGATALLLYDLGEQARIPFTHAYVAADAFDEVILRGTWLFLRSGNGYVALGGSAPLAPVTSGPTAGREYRLNGTRSAWAVRVSSGVGSAGFARFMDDIGALSLTFDNNDMSMELKDPPGKRISLSWAGGDAAVADTVEPRVTMSVDLEWTLARVVAGLSRLKAINETAAPLEDRYSIQFEEWDWEVGVGLYGLVRRAVATRDRELLDALERWYDWQIGRGLPPRQVNSTAPMLPLVVLLEHIDRPEWDALAKDWAEWLMDGLARTEEGGFQHVVKERPNTGELWDDTLFMTCLFLARAGRRFGRPEWIDEAVYQFLLHARYLSDPRTGLWYHGWTFIGHHNFAGAFWARGNAWITASIPELVDLLGGVESLPAATLAYLKSLLATQVRKLKRLQRIDGMFHTLLDDSGSPVETSATAGIAYGILRAAEIGLLPPDSRDVAWRGLDAVLRRIGNDGIVGEVSDGTAMGHDLAFYRRIPNVPAPYGQALAMLLLGEAIRQTQGATWSMPA